MSTNPALAAFFNRLVVFTRWSFVRRLLGGRGDERGFSGAVNFVFGDAPDAVWHCEMTPDRFQFFRGPHAAPLGAVQTDPHTFFQTLAGRTSFSVASMTGRIRVTGDGHCIMVLAGIVDQCRALARRRGISGWIFRRFLQNVVRQSGIGAELQL